LCSKFFPLPGHARARIAAGCAEFRRRQGKFWPMNDLLFAHQDELDDANLKAYAKQLGLDGAQMLKEVYAGRFEGAIESHLQEGIGARVQATPTVFVNGRQHVLPMKLQFLQRSVEDELEWQQNKAFVYEDATAGRRRVDTGPGGKRRAAPRRFRGDGRRSPAAEPSIERGGARFALLDSVPDLLIALQEERGPPGRSALLGTAGAVLAGDLATFPPATC